MCHACAQSSFLFHQSALEQSASQAASMLHPAKRQQGACLKPAAAASAPSTQQPRITRWPTCTDDLGDHDGLAGGFNLLDPGSTRFLCCRCTTCWLSWALSWPVPSAARGHYWCRARPPAQALIWGRGSVLMVFSLYVYPALHHELQCCQTAVQCKTQHTAAPCSSCLLVGCQT